MYIKEVKIKNYRNFGDPPFIIELKPFTLILGENNIGKTNLLNALGLLFSQEIIIFRKRLLEIDDINYQAVQKFKNQICDFKVVWSEIEFPLVSVEVTLTDLDKDQKAVAGDWFIDTNLLEARITYTFEIRANFDKEDWIKSQRDILHNNVSTETGKSELIDFPIGEYKYSIFGGNDPSNECNSYYLKMFKMEFLEALRDAQRELIAGGDYRLLYRILYHRDKSNYEGIRTKLAELERAVKDNPNLTNVKNEVEKLLARVSLQTTALDNSVDFSFSSLETSEMLKRLSLIYGANPINVARNGLGRNNLLYISLLLSHLSAKDVQGTSTYFRLVAIEEPEAHLHPHLQDHLAENIEDIRKEQDKSMQLLLTSHSTHIAAKLHLENTVVIFWDNQKSCLSSYYILSGLDDGIRETKKTIHYLSKYLDATKSRMFFARKIILVEGISEQLLIPKFFEITHGTTLEKHGCNVIDVNGVAFSHFLRIVQGGFFIKCVVLTDQDTGKKTQDRASDLKTEFDKADLIEIEISEQATFEKDIIFANCSGSGKDILLNALKETKPINGKNLAQEYESKDLDVSIFFAEIENYKAEFAFNLLQELGKPENNDKFIIPDYIVQGFRFIGAG